MFANDAYRKKKQQQYGYGGTVPTPYLTQSPFVQAVEDGRVPPPDPFLDDWRMTEEKLDLYRQALAEFVPEDRPLDVAGIANPYAANMPQWGMPAAGVADSQRTLQGSPSMGTRAPKPNAYGADAYTAGAAVSYANPYLPGISEQAEVMEIQSVGENPTVRLVDGRVIPLGDINFGDFETQGLYKIAAEFPDSATANMFLHVYQQSEVDVPTFLQVYRDVLRKDMQGGADAQENAPDSRLEMSPMHPGTQETPIRESGVFPEGMSLEAKNEALYYAYINVMNQYYPVQDSFDFQGEKNSQAAEDLQWIAQDATAAGMAIGEYFEAHPEKRPDWLNRVYYGEYAKRYGLPITQEDTWTLDALRPEEENLAAINELLAENGLPPLKSVDWSVVEDTLLADIMENGIMELYEPGQPEAETGAEDAGSITPADLYPVVMTPEQQKYLTEKNNEVLGLLTDEQKQRIRNGENIFSIIDELDPGKQTQIGELAQDVLSNLDQQQKTELMFLGSGMMEGLDLDTRLAILKHLKDNGGEITYDDLVDIGVYAPGTLAEGGLLRWLQNFDIGGPAHFGGLLAKEYRLNQFGTSFALLDQEERMRRGAEMTMLFAMAAAPLLDWMFNGSPNITLDPNKHLEGIELEGRSIEGSPSYIDPSQVGGNPDKPVVGAGVTKLYRVMSDAEYQSIIQNEGKFSKYENAMEEKWFAASPEDATKWADMFYPDGQYRMIEISIPTDSLKQMYHVEKLDGIGPAYCGGIDFLNSIMKGLILK